MKTITGIYTGLLMLGLLCLCGIAAAEQEASGTDAPGTLLTDDVQPYNGPIGADSPLYALKLALEDMDESFTANETERVNKQMDHARIRLSEVRRELELNQSDSAEQALNNYWLKMDLANVTIARWSSNATGLLHAQEMIAKHQFVLENLLSTHPNNTGLMHAYNNSLRLQERFEKKTAVKYQRDINKNNQTILKAIRLEQKEHNRIGWPDATMQPTITGTQLRQTEQEQNKNKKTGTPPPITTKQQGQGKGQGQQQDNTGNGNAGSKGQGGSKNR